MNQTATRRVRQSASIAAAALRDPSTAEILRETGFALIVHELPDGPAHQATRENSGAAEVYADFSGELPQPLSGGSPVVGSPWEDW